VREDRGRRRSAPGRFPFSPCLETLPDFFFFLSFDRLIEEELDDAITPPFFSFFLLLYGREWTEKPAPLLRDLLL